MSSDTRRVLLDECLPHDLRHELHEFDTQTADYAGVAGLSNGELVAAIEERFDVLVTIDGNLPDQQNLRPRNIAVIVLRAASNRLNDLLPLVPELIRQINNAQVGSISVIPFQKNTRPKC